MSGHRVPEPENEPEWTEARDVPRHVSPFAGVPSPGDRRKAAAQATPGPATTPRGAWRTPSGGVVLDGGQDPLFGIDVIEHDGDAGTAAPSPPPSLGAPLESPSAGLARHITDVRCLHSPPAGLARYATDIGSTDSPLASDAWTVKGLQTPRSSKVLCSPLSGAARARRRFSKVPSIVAFIRSMCRGADLSELQADPSGRGQAHPPEFGKVAGGRA